MNSLVSRIDIEIIDEFGKKKKRVAKLKDPVEFDTINFHRGEELIVVKKNGANKIEIDVTNLKEE